jgi:predicted metal-dependent hydrolase
MKIALEINGRQIEYKYEISRRTRHIRLAIYPGGGIVVRAPSSISQSRIQQFIKSKGEWILKKFDQQSLVKVKDPSIAKQEYKELKDIALKIAKSRIEYFNSFYRFKYGRISIKNHKTLWGSCSKKGNLNFSYKIAKLAPGQSDYIIVHELCHLQQFNHSEKFWDLVAQTIPDHKEIRRKLKKIGLELA